jgi:drug/metabolite transporter (DMT)-like permease
LSSAEAAARPRATAAPPPLAYLYLAVIVLSWALNWPLMKLAIGAVPPFVFVLLRLAGSVLLIAPALVASGQGLLPARGERLTLFWVGQLQVAGFLLCSIIGLSIVPAGRAIVLAYTMPLWAIPIGWFLWPEPIGRPQVAGAAIGFAGLLLFMNPGLIDWHDTLAVTGNALLVAAAILWALGSCLYRQRVWRSPFWVQTWWQLAASLPPVAVFAVAAGFGDGKVSSSLGHWSLGVIAILVYKCVVTTALGYFLWARVLSMMPAATAGQVLTLTPIGGFVLSTALFGGRVTLDIALSIVLIGAGIFVTLRRGHGNSTGNG